MYIYKVQNKSPPLQITLRKRNVWAISCVSVLRSRHFNAKSLKRQESLKKLKHKILEVTDTPPLIGKYCIIKKGKRQTGHWADSVHAFLVSSVTCETLTDDVTWCTIKQVPVTLSIYVLYLCTQQMSSFCFQIITLKKNRTLNFYFLCHIFDQFLGEWPTS